MNYIPEAFRDFAETGANLVNESKQNAMSLIIKVKDLRDDPDFFEKAGQVASYCIQLFMLNYPGAKSLSKLDEALQTLLLHDAYTFLKKPREWIYLVSADMIEENEVLASLSAVLQDQIDPNHLNVQDVQTLAEECLKKRLKSMRKEKDAYESVDEFKKVLKRQIRATIHPTFDLTAVKLTNLQVPLRHVPLLEKITSLNFAIVDTLCLGIFLQQWELIDTAKWAEIGQVPGFQWAKHQNLQTWMVALVCTGFTLKLLEAVRKLNQESLTEEERGVARWSIVTSLFEFTFYGAIYLNRIGRSSIKHSTIQWLGIVAKAFGLICIASKPAHEFFQPKTAPAA